MKRSLLFFIGSFLVVLLSTAPADAEKHISFAQLEETIAQLKSASDSEAAQHLAELQLTERLSPKSFAALAQLLPGEKSQQALRAVSDQSQFLNPPASEIPPNPAPAVAEQRRIMGLVVNYVTHAVPQIPNFFATRTTAHFEGSPHIVSSDLTSLPYEPIHFVDNLQATVLYRDGREVEETGTSEKPRPILAGRGLTSRGEFGYILSTVLLDAAQNKLEWMRWEQSDTLPIAVFSFTVPKARSHFELDYCCVSDSEGRTRTWRQLVGYSGTLAVDPQTGAVLRIVINAEIKPGEPISMAKLAVEYGSVSIGGRTYTCPIHSIAFSRAQGLAKPQQQMVVGAAHGQSGGNPTVGVVVGTTPSTAQQALLNDVSFTNYHMFRSDMRILTPEEANLAQQAKATPSPVTSTAPLLPLTASPEPAPSTASASSEPKPEATPAAPPATSESKTESAPAAEEAAPAPSAAKTGEPVPSEITTTTAATLPDLPSTSAASTSDTGFRLRTTTRLVEVTVVAFDKKGHPITDLKPADFEIFDNGRKQTVNSLTQAAAEAASRPAASSATTNLASGEQRFTNRPAEESATPAESTQRVSGNTTVFLVDASHVSFADLTHARNEMLRFLRTVPSDEPVALYVLKKFGFEVLREPTTDHDQIATTLRSWMPSAQDLAQSQQEEMRNRQQMEYVRSSFDMLAMNGKNPTGSDDYQSAPDIQRRSLGDSPEQNALQYLVWVARHIAAFKGHKTLIWVASDNVLADFSEKAPQNEKGDKYLDPLSLRAREALNEAQVSIYPLDSSQLEGGVVGADIQHANVQVNPTATAAQEISPSGSTLKPGDTANREDLQAMEQARRDVTPGRLTAQLQQDTHPIQGTFRELAQATGGRALRRSSDIAAELDSIVNDGRAAYTLSFTPDTPADGAYHHLTVKLATRHDINLRYRTGYLYEKEPATLKERFQNAVWRPADFSEIALSATPAANSNPAVLKLNVVATDLALAQQAGLWMDRLDIFLVQRDDALFHAKIDGETLAMRLKPSTYEKVLKEGIDVDQPIKSVPDTGALRIVVIDENTGRIGTLTLPASAFKKKQ